MSEKSYKKLVLEEVMDPGFGFWQREWGGKDGYKIFFKEYSNIPYW